VVGADLAMLGKQQSRTPQQGDRTVAEVSVEIHLLTAMADAHDDSEALRRWAGSGHILRFESGVSKPR